MLENKSANCDASLWVLESSVRKIFVGMQGTAGTSLRNNGSLRAILHWRPHFGVYEDKQKEEFCSWREAPSVYACIFFISCGRSELSFLSRLAAQIARYSEWEILRKCSIPLIARRATAHSAVVRLASNTWTLWTTGHPDTTARLALEISPACMQRHSTWILWDTGSIIVRLARESSRTPTIYAWYNHDSHWSIKWDNWL